MKISMAMGIFTALMDGRRHSATQLAKQFEISTRSVYRYMDALGQAGVPVEVSQGRSGGWQIDPQFRLASTYFTDEEYSEICFIVDSCDKKTPLVETISAKLKSLGRGKYDAGVLASQQIVVSSPSLSQLNSKLQVVRQALSDNLVLKVCYHNAKGEVTQRDIEPVTLVLKEGVWYVYAYCRLRRAFRYFKLSRIVNPVVTPTKFRPRPYSVDVDQIQSSVVANKCLEEIILTVNADALTQVEDWLGMENVKPVDNYYIARANVVVDDFTVNKVLSLGSGVTVEKPEKLRVALSDKCRAILDNYN